jgi:2-phosphoglycolate phosphatase
MSVNTLRAVLFDLDGTLLDTAPDMVGALDLLRAEQGHGPVNYEFARAHVSNGALGLIDISFEDLDQNQRMDLRDRYLALYESRLATATVLFAGMAEVLTAIEKRNMPWGIVTNKPAYLTEPLLASIKLRDRCACVVSGDTLAERKPDPKPLLHAAALINMEPGQAMYVGDSGRDIAAGNAAGMLTVAAGYGFVAPGDDPDLWAADHKIEHPSELLAILNDYA